ncbi:MAG: SDR family NAD(P)-dependent oxidoreductase [Phototrophicaceae bacterium]|nr:MAG: short-chain dehydrogenase/reductase SDR [Chloroflexi bacterium OLB13]MBV6438240.1 Levodione reductase [Anaerolineae bacterium]MBW7879835.1 SDR family NAD(P)-dependent oxidoreductase [Anaerolineae bacterium]
MSLDGKVVMVTGGGGNLGRGVAAVFSGYGARLALVDLQADRVNQIAAALPGGVESHAGFGGDLSTPEGVQAVIDAVLSRFGRIDALVHTVGGFSAGNPVHQESLDVLDGMINLNVRPLYLVGGAVARHMLDRGEGGSIVFILARAGLKGAKNMAAYTASKAAATRVMESMAAELKEFNIHVNGVSPSTIDTPANRESMPNADPGKWVTAAQVAEVCAFLCGGDTGVYGANLEVFGKS